MMPWYIKTLSLLNHLLSFLNLGMFLRKCFYRNKKNLFFGSKMGGGVDLYTGKYGNLPLLLLIIIILQSDSVLT